MGEFVAVIISRNSLVDLWILGKPFILTSMTLDIWVWLDSRFCRGKRKLYFKILAYSATICYWSFPESFCSRWYLLHFFFFFWMFLHQQGIIAKSNKDGVSHEYLWNCFRKRQFFGSWVWRLLWIERKFHTSNKFGKFATLVWKIISFCYIKYWQ